jgi:hypothetical protein
VGSRGSPKEPCEVRATLSTRAQPPPGGAGYLTVYQTLLDDCYTCARMRASASFLGNPGCLQLLTPALRRSGRRHAVLGFVEALAKFLLFVAVLYTPHHCTPILAARIYRPLSA